MSVELALDGAAKHLVKFRVVKIWPWVLTRRQSEVKENAQEQSKSLMRSPDTAAPRGRYRHKGIPIKFSDKSPKSKHASST